MPKVILFLGSCGEYELLFTISEKSEKEFISAALKEKLIFYRLGKIVKNTLSKLLIENGKPIKLNEININARNYDDVKIYLRELIDLIKKQYE